MENLLAIFWSFLDAGRFPVDVYPGWLRVTLSTVVPIGIAVTLPAQAIAGRLDALALVGMVAGTVGVCWFGTWFGAKACAATPAPRPETAIPIAWR